MQQRHPPKRLCTNTSCDCRVVRPDVTETERKTLWRCPQCSHITDIDWHTDP